MKFITHSRRRRQKRQKQNRVNPRVGHGRRCAPEGLNCWWFAIQEVQLHRNRFVVEWTRRNVQSQRAEENRCPGKLLQGEVRRSRRRWHENRKIGMRHSQRFHSEHQRAASWFALRIERHRPWQDARRFREATRLPRGRHCEEERCDPKALWLLPGRA